MAFIIKNGITDSVGAGAYWTVQPAAGEQWLITSVGLAAITNMKIVLYNGTDEADVFVTNALVNNFGINPANLKLLVDNTIYFRILNNSGGVADAAYCGVLL